MGQQSLGMNNDFLQRRLQNWLMRETAGKDAATIDDLSVAIATDVGLVRKENQDRIAVLRFYSPQGSSFIVGALCDGMGGMVDGSTCAAIALSTFFATCVRFRDRPIRERLSTATSHANILVYESYGGRGGATLSAFLVDSSGARSSVNVGDSRIYQISSGKLEQLSVDDTLAGQVERTSPLGSGDNHFGELLQFIGVGPALEPHLIDIDLPSSSHELLLTTDGAHSVTELAMRGVVSNADDPLIGVSRLTELANWLGGHDNASVMLASSLDVLGEYRNEPTGIAVWDPFGEFQLVGIDQESFQLVPRMNPVSFRPKDHPDSNATDHLKSGKKKRTRKSKSSKKKTNKSSRQSKKKPATDSAVPASDEKQNKPQLKMKFDKSQSGDEDKAT